MLKKPINQDLYEATKNLVIAVSKFLLKDRKLILANKQNVGIVLLNRREKISQLSETKSCGNIMLSESEVRREFASRLTDNNGNPFEKPDIQSIFDFYLRGILGQYFRSLGDIGFDKEIFDPLYGEYEKYLYSDQIDYCIRSPLVGFSSDVETLQLDKDLKIRRLTEEERGKLWKTTETNPFPLLQMFDALSLKFTIETPLSHKKGKPLDRSTIDRKIETILCLLRLFKRGKVELCFTQRINKHWNPYLGTGYSFKKRSGYRGEYRLENEEIENSQY